MPGDPGILGVDLGYRFSKTNAILLSLMGEVSGTRRGKDYLSADTSRPSSMESPEQTKGRWKRPAIQVVRDFRSTILMVSAILGICAIVQGFITLGFVTREQLDASKANLLTVVTAVFTHYSWSSFLGNAEWFLVYTAIFIVANLSLSAAERVFRARWYATLLLPVAIGLNLQSVLLFGGDGRGASGALFTGVGILLAFCIVNITTALARLRQEKLQGQAKRNKGLAAPQTIWELGMNGLVFVWFLAEVAIFPGLMVGFGDPTVSVWAHVTGLTLGAGLTLVFHYTPKAKTRVGASGRT